MPCTRRQLIGRIGHALAVAPLAAPPLAGLAALLAGAPVRADSLPPKPAAQPVNAGPYVPSPDSVVVQMLDMAAVGPDDVLIDMGSGDGRIVLTAAKLRGARGVGIEIQDKLVALSKEAALREGVAERARFVKQDLFTTDVSEATVVTIYLLPHTVNMLEEKLRRELRPGTRVLTHDYPISGWLPERWETFDEPEKRDATGVPQATIYLYRVPAAVGGQWQMTLPAPLARQPVSLELRQQWQMLDGAARVGAREVSLEQVVLRGRDLSFRLALERGRMPSFVGRASDGVIEGTVEVDGSRLPWRATRLR